MKLLKKLLPIATVASTAAVVVPLATSCTGMSDFDYTPTVPMHENKTYDSLKEAVGEYYSQVKENTQILVQDYYWTIAQQQKELKAELIKEYKDVSISFSVNASVSFVGMTTIDEQNIYYLSCSIKQSQKASYSYESTKTGKKVTTTYSADSSATEKCEKVAFKLSYDTSSGWYISLYIPDKYVEQWSIETKGTTKSSERVVSDTIDDYDENVAKINQVYNKDNPISYIPIQFKSYYFQNVKIK